MVMDQRLRSWVTGQYDKRDAVLDETYLWPESHDGKVRVPYTLSDEILEGKGTTFVCSCCCASLYLSVSTHGVIGQFEKIIFSARPINPQR